MHSRILGISLALSILSSTATPQPVDSDDLAGVVRSDKGPEAGVWVIAETTELPTRYAKIVVTDNEGRYLMPDLPKASYAVWVRGYGLVDSPKVRSVPGKSLDLKAIVAPNARAAAEYYPAGYWWSLLHVPEAKEFPGTGPDGNGISPEMKSQAANSVSNIVYGLKDETAAKARALREAAIDAKAKSDALADALGVTVLGILSATEGEPDIVRPMPMYRGAEMAMADAPPTPVEAGAIEVKASVTLVVAIKP